jgi:hypothetical protein
MIVLINKYVELNNIGCFRFEFREGVCDIIKKNKKYEIIKNYFDAIPHRENKIMEINFYLSALI